MPTNLTYYFVLLLAVVTLATFNSATTVRGLAFEKLTMNEALQKAKVQGKPVFVYVFASWCGQCKQLKRTTFKDEAVGEYFNKNFINIAIDGESPEGSAFAKRFNVDSYPTLLIIDGNGNLKTKTKGVMKPYILINFGRRIVP